MAAAVMMALLIPLAVRFLARCSFAVGVRWIVCPLLVGCVVRSLVIGLQDPAFDLGVRKILLMRLTCRFTVLAGWLRMHRRNELLRRRRAWRHRVSLRSQQRRTCTFPLPLMSVLARNALLPLVRPWLRHVVALGLLAAAGRSRGQGAARCRRQHVCRAADACDRVAPGCLPYLPLAAQSVLQGFLMLSACILVCGGVKAILVWWLLDRPGAAAA